jgi:hypothetical protein
MKLVLLLVLLACCAIGAAPTATATAASSIDEQSPLNTGVARPTYHVLLTVRSFLCCLCLLLLYHTRFFAHTYVRHMHTRAQQKKTI